MKISNNLSPAFNGYFVQDKKMNQTQKNISSDILNAITYSDEYLNADASNIDIFITPNHDNHHAVNVRYMDKDNGYYIRDKENKIVQTMIPVEWVQEKADELITQIRDVVSGKFGFRGYDSEVYTNLKSDLAKVRPELYED